MPRIFPARRINLLVDGTQVSGVQSVEYKLARKHHNIESIGTSERIGVEYGLQEVTGKIKVISVCDELDRKLYKAPEEASFQLIVRVVAPNGQAEKEITFDECYLLDRSTEVTANGLLVTVYSFTATRIRESDIQESQGGGGAAGGGAGGGP
ncbi:MAG TPA: hypothetical protein ENF55_00715 [Thermoprotei archaeon]|nr:hypothetical protein [Thermoprotei archaeon]